MSRLISSQNVVGRRLGKLKGYAKRLHRTPRASPLIAFQSVVAWRSAVVLVSLCGVAGSPFGRLLFAL
jgi:hypothetical protein